MSVRAIARTALSEVTTPGEASRVAQLDAFRLDAELVAIVMDHVNHVMAQTPPRLRGFLSIYLGKLIRALIAVGSILHNGSTPGMSELGLCFTLLRGSQKPRAADVKELLPLITLQHLLPEAWLQIRHSVASQSLRAAASERSQPWAWTWISAFERLTSLSTLLNLLMFLYNGRYFTLSQRLTRKVMTHVDPNEGRTVSFEYLNQQLVWGELQHFVMFLLPLLTPGSLAANNFLATATAKVMRFCDVRGDRLNKNKAGAADVCCLCSTERILVAVETLCCGSRCCYMCAQRHWQLEQQPRCPCCVSPFNATYLQPIYAEPEA